MKILNKALAIPLFIFLLTSCSSGEDPVAQTPDPDPDPVQNVFERLQGNTFRQIEKSTDCATCEDEVNYYIFSKTALQITGTTPDGACEQNDLQPIGTCSDCATVETNNENELTLCLGSLCQTITFLSDTEIQFDFPTANETWTAQLYTDQPPCTDWDPVGNGADTVLGKLLGNTYQQIERVSDCGTCEDEINYYMFSEDGLRITGTTLDGICEQNDFTAFGEDVEIELNSTEQLRVCAGVFPFRFCQTVTFLSENEIQFDFPFFDETWTAQLYTEDVPCTGWAPSPNPVFTGAFDGALVEETETGTTFEWPSSAQSWAGFANDNTDLYPLSFPNGGSVTFTAATSGVDIDVRFRIEFDVWPDVDPAYDTPPTTISGTTPQEYTVEIPAQGSNTYSSLLFYLMTKDQELIVSSDFVLTIN